MQKNRENAKEGAAGKEWKVKYCKEGEGLILNIHMLQQYNTPYIRIIIMQL